MDVEVGIVPLFYESNYRYLHHMLHILSNMQLNQNQMWSKVLCAAH